MKCVFILALLLTVVAAQNDPWALQIGYTIVSILKMAANADPSQRGSLWLFDQSFVLNACNGTVYTRDQVLEVIRKSTDPFDIEIETAVQIQEMVLFGYVLNVNAYGQQFQANATVGSSLTILSVDVLNCPQ